MKLEYVDAPAEAGQEAYGSDVNPFFPGLVFQITGYRLVKAKIDGTVQTRTKKLFKTNIGDELQASLMTNRYVDKNGTIYRSQGSFSEWYRESLRKFRSDTNDEALKKVVAALAGRNIIVRGREIVKTGDFASMVLDFEFQKPAEQPAPQPAPQPEAQPAEKPAEQPAPQVPEL